MVAFSSVHDICKDLIHLIALLYFLVLLKFLHFQIKKFLKVKANGVDILAFLTAVRMLNDFVHFDQCYKMVVPFNDFKLGLLTITEYLIRHYISFEKLIH